MRPVARHGTRSCDAPVSVSVTFGQPVAKITEYDPVDHGTTPVAEGEGDSFKLQLPAHPVLLRIAPRSTGK